MQFCENLPQIEILVWLFDTLHILSTTVWLLKPVMTKSTQLHLRHLSVISKDDDPWRAYFSVLVLL